MKELTFDIKRLQNRLLQMARSIATVLEEADIPYEIAFGTLLGAVRHKGFIPWDDDFDFFLFDDTYQKAMEVLSNELPCDMFLEYEKTEPKYFHSWAHVKDLNSYCECDHYPQDSLYCHKGISVDLYKLTEIKERDLQKFRYDSAVRYIELRREYGFIEEEDFRKRKSQYEKFFDGEGTDSDNKILAYPLDIGRQEFDDVFPLKRYVFEDTEFWGPCDANAILTKRYGKYMELPPEEERIPHYSKVVFYE